VHLAYKSLFTSYRKLFLSFCQEIDLSLELRYNIFIAIIRLKLYKESIMKKFLGILGVMSLILVFSACDHTDLSGEVTVITTTHRLDEPIAFVLDVPEELNDIYRVMWAADSVEDGTRYAMIYGEELIEHYSEAELLELFDGRKIEADRMAVFIPKKAGDYIIDVEGFYKQTNPQPITQMQIEIKD
jgi:hypothetical protein